MQQKFKFRCRKVTYSSVDRVNHFHVSGTSCLDIQNKGLSHGDGKYLIDPDGDGLPFEAHCDMTSFDGGWTMCYTTDSHVNIKTEFTTTDALGYRADCNNIPVRLISFTTKVIHLPHYF